MSVIIFIAVLVVIVLVHEWGHFFAARSFGIRVDEFGFGFPPRILAKKVGETIYSLNLVPLGGFVRLFGESGEGADNKKSFASHPIWHRVVIILAGVFMNLVLAWVLFSIGFGIGVPSVGDSDTVNQKVTITDVASDGPAAKAKISFGSIVEKLVATNESLVPKSADDLVFFVNRHKGETLHITIQNGSDTQVVDVEARKNPPAGEGPLGIALADVGIYKVAWYKAPWYGAKSLWYALRATLEAFGSIFKSGVIEGRIPESVSGPIGVFVLTNQFAKLGFVYFIQFVAALSVSLAVLNVIPFPGLDGGRILFLLTEKIRGRPVHMRHEQLAHTAGIILILILVLFISFHDVRHYFL
ncbi:MAG: site-2 protease family protein [Candidatus Sungbacteria bacterium]|uniref:Site-2 protease family protein n=1 Tax=Candidatus Sungiibacteriota bacterium TaxID=2750080 RepID=A0A9D6QSC8_9BACT|nr:site-2 protease family protein [Candidatus Sungbacteria bacterium]